MTEITIRNVIKTHVTAFGIIKHSQIYFTLFIHKYTHMYWQGFVSIQGVKFILHMCVSLIEYVSLSMSNGPVSAVQNK